jgi:hypothetical protein
MPPPLGWGQGQGISCWAGLCSCDAPSVPLVRGQIGRSVCSGALVTAGPALADPTVGVAHGGGELGGRQFLAAGASAPANLPQLHRVYERSPRSILLT